MPAKEEFYSVNEIKKEAAEQIINSTKHEHQPAMMWRVIRGCDILNDMRIEFMSDNIIDDVDELAARYYVWDRWIRSPLGAFPPKGKNFDDDAPKNIQECEDYATSCGIRRDDEVVAHEIKEIKTCLWAVYSFTSRVAMVKSMWS